MVDIKNLVTNFELKRWELIMDFFFFFLDEKISIKVRKGYSKAQTASPNYKQSKCIWVLTTGGETPLHKWHTLLHRANLASSCATLLKSPFICRICQQAKPSRRPTVPLTMWPRPPLKSLDKMRWTVDKESDSMMICWRSNSLARRIPASIAKASVSSTVRQPGRTRQRAAAAWPLQSLKKRGENNFTVTRVLPA